MSKEMELALKAGLSVGITLLIGKIFKIDSLFYASIAAAICSQVEYKKSFDAGLGRILGTIVGALIGCTFFYLLPKNEFFMGVGVFLIFYLTNKYIKFSQAAIGSVVFLGILLGIQPQKTPVGYFVHRVLDTSIGVVVALVISNIPFTKTIEK